MISKIIPISFGVLTRLFQNIIIYVLLARLFEPEEFAFLALVFALVFMFSNMLDFGLRLRIGVEFNAIFENLSKFITTWLILKVLGFIVFLVLLSFYIIFYTDNYQEGIFFFGALLSGLILTIASFFTYLLSADEYYYPEIVVNLFLLLGSLLSIFLITSTNNNFWLIYILILTNFLGLFISFYLFSRRFGVFRLSIKLVSLSQLFSELKNSFPYALHLFFTIFIGYFDLVLIEILSSRSVLADYQILTRIVLGLSLPIVVVSIFLPPRLRKSEQPIRLGKFINKILVLLSITISLIYFLFDSEIITLIFGDNYSDLTIFSGITLFIVFLKYLQIVPGTLISFFIDQMTRAISLAITALFLIIGFVFLVPIYELKGGLMALAFSNLLLLMLYLYLTRNLKEEKN